ncbi:MAG: signal peptidase I [Gaiellaceae bacterium]
MEGRQGPVLHELLADARAQMRLLRRIAAASLVVLGLGAAAIPVAGLATGGWHVLPILSDSMRPAFAGGDLVLAQRTPVSSVRRGDVLVYNIPVGDKRLTAHRVVDVVQNRDRRAVRTKGDANRGPDPWLARLEGATAWKVEASVPALGHAILLANRPWMRSLGIWVAIAAFLGLALRAIWLTPRKDNHDAARGSRPTPATG